jgi:hypothetical protein
MVVANQPGLVSGELDKVCSVLHWIHTASQFGILICVLFVLPTAYPVTVENMNYAVVAIGGILLLTVANWSVWGRHSFKGPVATVEHDAVAEKPDHTSTALW